MPGRAPAASRLVIEAPGGISFGMVSIWRQSSVAARVLVAASLLLLVQFADEACALGRGQDPERAYVDGLRARRLFSLAEKHCLRRLAEANLDAAERATLTVELSRCFAEHATYRTGHEQAELWDRAQTVVDQLLADDPRNPRRELLILQAALVPAARGEWLRWQAELAPHDAALRESAVARLQEALTALRGAQSALTERLRTAGPATDVRGSTRQPNAAELRRLLGEARFRIGVASLDLARLLPEGIERTAALREAESRLNDLARASGDSRQWTARLLLATAARIRGDYEEAHQRLVPLTGSGVPAEFRNPAAAEAARIELLRGDVDAALERLARGDTTGAQDELLCVGVEARLLAAQQAAEQGEKDRAHEWLEQAAAIDRQISGAWRARSAALLEAARQSAEYGGDLAPLVLAARAAHQHGDVPAAIEQYRRAVEAAQTAARPELAAELLRTRASILLAVERYEEASEDFLAAAQGPGDLGRRAEAHLLSAYCRGKLWEARPTQARREAYAAVLEQHRAQYSDQPTHIEATWMLAAFHEARLQWADALELYRLVPSDHPRGPLARVRIAALHRQILQHLQQTGQPRDDWEDRALAELTGFVDLMPLPPAALSTRDAEVALVFARIVLDHRAPRYDDADALLDRVVDSSRTATRQAELDGRLADPAWAPLEQAAEQLRIVSLAGQDRLEEARERLGRLSDADPEAVLEVLDGLCEVAGAVRAERRSALAQVQLEAAEELLRRKVDLDETGQRRLDECLAQAFAALGRPNDAARAYRRLLERSPDDRQLLATAAEGLTATGLPQALREAKSLWRRLEALEKPGSRAWLTARLQVARTAHQLGEYEECRKLLRVTRLLYPELGGEELRARFDQLEAALDERR